MIKPKQVDLPDDSFENRKNPVSLSLRGHCIASAKVQGQNRKSIAKWFTFVLMFLMMQAGTHLFAQELNISGKVTSAEDGLELIGANIVEKGTTNGTTTNFDGEFSIKVQSGAVLVFSYVGFLPKEVTVTNETELNVSLEVDVQQLQDVVVVGIGYGEVKKADLTGSVAAISAKDFNQGTITSPQELLIGKAPGVVANSLGGAAGANTKIRIRGGSSIQGNNDPLIVVDNIPLENSGISGMANPLSTINPNDIESFTILKDASATAIYGSRASNGVIIIKTKRGVALKEGQTAKMSVNYSANVSMSTAINTMSVFSGDEFRAMVQDRVANHGLTSAALDLLGDANTDWQDQIYRTAASTEHNLSLSHAIGNVPYRVSLGYTHQGGILKYNSLDRKNISLAATPTLLDGALTMDLNASATLLDNNFSNNDAIGSAVEFDPTQPITNGNTKYGGYTAGQNSVILMESTEYRTI